MTTETKPHLTPYPCRVHKSGRNSEPNYTILSPGGIRLGWAYEQETASLWAGAPELLRACKGLMEHAHRIAEMADLDDSHPFWAEIQDAADAIAKATE